MRWGQALRLGGHPGEAATSLERGDRLARARSDAVDPELRYWLARARGELDAPGESAHRQMLALRESLAAEHSDDARPDVLAKVQRWLDEHGH